MDRFYSSHRNKCVIIIFIIIVRTCLHCQHTDIDSLTYTHIHLENARTTGLSSHETRRIICCPLRTRRNGRPSSNLIFPSVLDVNYFCSLNIYSKWTWKNQFSTTRYQAIDRVWLYRFYIYMKFRKKIKLVGTLTNLRVPEYVIILRILRSFHSPRDNMQ